MKLLDLIVRNPVRTTPGPRRRGERKVRIHAIGFPTLFDQSQYPERTGLRFATLMRLLCERNGGAFVGLSSLAP